MVHEVWGRKDHPSGLDRNPVQILALRIHIKDRGQLNVCPGTCSFQAQCYLPVGAKLKNCKLRGTYLIHISKVPPLGASVDPLSHCCTLCNQIDQDPVRSQISKMFLLKTATSIETSKRKQIFKSWGSDWPYD